MPGEPHAVSGGRVDPPAATAGCERCGNLLRVFMFTRNDAAGRTRPVLLLCAACIADALSIATGYSFNKQLGNWDDMSAEASARSDLSHRSRKAKQKIAERESARATLQGKAL